jgi:hypothetical protein
VLKYRLYEIDQLINRTLAYGLLTVLSALYAGVVLVLGKLLAGAAPRRRAGRLPARRWRARRCSCRPAVASSTWWTGGSTGAPHDAARTVEAFSTRLRDQIDLDTLSTELLAVVDQTIEPTGCRCGFDPPRTAPRAHPAVRHGQLTGPTELVIRTLYRPLPTRSFKCQSPQRRTARRFTLLVSTRRPIR